MAQVNQLSARELRAHMRNVVDFNIANRMRRRCDSQRQFRFWRRHTLNGIPLSGASIILQPQEGRPASGDTDEKGYYRLS
jgi:hypothetical protein